VQLNTVPVDQSAFIKMRVNVIEKRTDRETGIQLTNQDGTERKWTVECVMSLPSRWDPTRTDSDVIPVTVTSATDPSTVVAEGELVEFENLTVGVMAPEKTDAGRIRGGRLFWQATGVRSKVPAGHGKARSDG
jgi:hypothetical protein